MTTRPLRLLLTAAALLLTGCGSAAAAALFGPTAAAPSTVTYCNDGGKPQTLDVYGPESGPAPPPTPCSSSSTVAHGQRVARRWTSRAS